MQIRSDAAFYARPLQRHEQAGLRVPSPDDEAARLDVGGIDLENVEVGEDTETEVALKVAVVVALVSLTFCRDCCIWTVPKV